MPIKVISFIAVNFQSDENNHIAEHQALIYLLLVGISIFKLIFRVGEL